MIIVVSSDKDDNGGEDATDMVLDPHYPASCVRQGFTNEATLWLEHGCPACLCMRSRLRFCLRFCSSCFRSRSRFRARAFFRFCLVDSLTSGY